MGLKDLMDSIYDDQEKLYELDCSYVEIYNDKVSDLLKKPIGNEKEDLKILESEGDIQIKGF